MVPNRIITQGNKESIDPQRNPIQFIKYDDKTNSGFATLKCSLNKENKTIDLEFSSAELKSAANAIAGSYKGPYSEYSVPALNNQWAYNRQAKDIVSADYFEMEDGVLTHLELLPIELGFGEPRYRLGNPRVRTDCKIIERLAEMSLPYGTKISIDERGVGIVQL